MEIITSAQNPKIKALLELREKSRSRKEQGLFVVEGRRELEHCLAAGYEVHSVFICPARSGACTPSELRASRSSHHRAAPDGPPVHETTGGHGSEGAQTPDLPFTWPQAATARQGTTGTISTKAQATDHASLRVAKREVLPTLPENPTYSGKVFEVSPQVYEKIALRDGTEGVVAEVRMKQHDLEGLNLGKNPVVCVIEGVEKPGNVGAILRSCDAAGIDALIICDPRCDVYNPNLIRASIGAVFTVPMAVCSSEEAISFLKERGIRILTAQLQDSSLYYDTDMTRGTAIVMGTEATGLTDIWREAADTHIRIPMLGQLDSLNVSVSAAILLFEAVRQRQGAFGLL